MKAPKKNKNIIRCTWASNDLSILYHDREWGVPQHDDRVLFEFLILEGAQAGLELGHDSTEARKLSRGLRWLRSAENRSLRHAKDAAVAAR